MKTIDLQFNTFIAREHNIQYMFPKVSRILVSRSASLHFFVLAVNVLGLRINAVKKQFVHSASPSVHHEINCLLFGNNLVAVTAELTFPFVDLLSDISIRLLIAIMPLRLKRLQVDGIYFVRLVR